MEQQPDTIDKTTENMLLLVGIAATSVCLVIMQGELAVALFFICVLLSLLKLLRRVTKQNNTAHKTSTPIRFFLHKVLIPTIQAILLIPVAIFLLFLALALICAAKIHCDPSLGSAVLILIPLSATWFILSIAKDKEQDQSTTAPEMQPAQESESPQTDK
jgi:hypothetical protein